MKKLYRNSLVTVIVFAFIALLPISCGILCNDPCGCSPQFEVKDFNILSFETLSLTKSGQRVDPNTPLPYDQIFKSFRVLDIQTLSYSEKSETSSMLGLAFACSPITPKSVQMMTDVRLINLKEVTLGDGTVLQLGQDITEFFEVNYFFEDKTLPFNSFFKKPLTIYQDDLFKLGWIQDPKKEIILEFNIRIFMTGGMEFNLNNEILSIR